MKRILFTICGRAGSQGIRGKNSRDFLEIPLAYYTLATIELYRERYESFETQIALNTDSPHLAELFDRSGISYLQVSRPSELAGDKASKVAVIAQTLDACEDSTGTCYDYVVDLDITSPLRTVDDLATVITKRESSTADTVFTVTGSRRNPYFNMVRKGSDGFYERVLKSNFNTRQEAPLIYDMNASIYAYIPSFLRSGKQIFEGTCDVVEMMDTAVLDLDGEDDFELMEVVAKHLFGKEPAFREVHDRALLMIGFDAGSFMPEYVNRQLEFFGSADVSPYFNRAVEKSIQCYASNTNKYFSEPRVDPAHTGKYAIFLCWLAREAFLAGDAATAGKVYQLNKMLHGFDIYYEVDLPDVFFMEHPVGTVLGRAKYSDRLFIGQSVTVGGNKGSYPIIGENVALHAGAVIVGNTVIGDNVEVCAGAFIRDEKIPDNCLVFGESPNIVIKERSPEEMRNRLYYFEYDEEGR